MPTFKRRVTGGMSAVEVSVRGPEPPRDLRNIRAWREQLTSIRAATEINLHGEEGEAHRA